MEVQKRDPTKRFSSRVENYVKYRPGYPQAVIGFLKKECGLAAGQTVADIGSGTGKLTELFLRNGNRVIGVEPNKEMREAGERFLRDFQEFKSVEGTAEATTLANGSVDMIVAGQAFHWFDRKKTRPEFARILNPHGFVALIWNDRKTDTTVFLEDYEQLMQNYGTDYNAVNHRNIQDEKTIGAFFAPATFQKASFQSAQLFDFEGLKGRVLSSSYAPEAGHPKHLPMLDALRELFDRNAANGTVSFDYDTVIYYGRLSGQ